mmetsp:Transcript_59751/g.167455  ORF Transcript_59751/g.167455 Transcript_59751/m.167455 type:complete len:201 (-) Transcript_59751:84-686(-)
MTMPSMRLCQMSANSTGPAKPHFTGRRFGGASASVPGCAASTASGLSTGCAPVSSAPGSAAFTLTALPEDAFMESKSSWRRRPTSHPTMSAEPQAQERVTSSMPLSNTKLSGRRRKKATAIIAPQEKASNAEQQRLLMRAATGPRKETKSKDGSDVTAALPAASHMSPPPWPSPGAGDSSTGSIFSPRRFRRKWNSTSNS